MAISAGDCVLAVGADTKDFDQSMNQMEGKVKSSMENVKKSLRIGGAALTGLGVAGLKMVDTSKEMNAKLGVTALNLGVTTEEMRNLALETTNVTFPLNEVAETFDLLARAGVEDQQVLKDVATAFDTLGDAIGMPASSVTEKLIPAMNTFGVTATEMADKTDALTYLFRNTTVSLDDFNRMVGYVTPDLVEMGLTTEDMIAILAELEDQGYAGEVMTREFRKAVTEARKEQIPLNEALGISTEKIESYKGKLEGATGMTQEYADVANEQYGIMDDLKQKWSELTLKASGFLEPLEPVLAGMTALGPLMIGLSMMNIPMLMGAIGKLGFAIKAALAFTMTHPVIIGIGLLIAAGVLLWQNWDKVCEYAGNLRDWLIGVWNTISSKGIEIWEGIRNFFTDIWEKIKGIFQEHWDKILAILFPAVGLPLLIARNWDQITEVVGELWDRVKEIFSGIWDTALEWGKNLVHGFWEGIVSMGEWIKDKITGFFEGLWDSITGFFEFGSPSKLAMKAGKDIALGLGEGIEGGIEDILRHIRGSLQGIQAGITISPGMAPAMAPAMVGTMAPAGVIPPVGATITNEFNIAQLVVREEADVPRIARELLRIQQLRVLHG